MSKIYKKIFKCSSCNKEYSLPWYIDSVSRDKIYVYELIDYTRIQTECPYCRAYNCKELERQF